MSRVKKLLHLKAFVLLQNPLLPFCFMVAFCCSSGTEVCSLHVYSRRMALDIIAVHQLFVFLVIFFESKGLLSHQFFFSLLDWHWASASKVQRWKKHLFNNVHRRVFKGSKNLAAYEKIVAFLRFSVHVWWISKRAWWSGAEWKDYWGLTTSQLQVQADKIFNDCMWIAH